MSKDPHYAALETMYLGAPINVLYKPTIEVADGRATIEMDVTEQMLHAGKALHGSVYFKMLDDAAFFAANSLEREVFVLTASFTTYLTRPVFGGALRSVGEVVSRTKSQFIAEAILYDSDVREAGRGNGIFVRSKSALRDVEGYDA